MKSRSHLWAYLAIALAIACLLVGCATLDSLLGVDNGPDPSWKVESSPVIKVVEGIGNTFGPIGSAIASVIASLAGAYAIIRKNKKAGDADHNSNAQEIATIKAALVELSQKNS